MIDLVLKGARKESGSLDRLFLALPIEPLDRYPRGPDDRRVEAGHAEASLLFELHPVAHQELRVDHHDQSLRIATQGYIDHEQPQRDADLCCREPDAGRGVHRLDHVVDEPLKVVVESGDVGGGSVQRTVAVPQDRSDHWGWNRSRTASDEAARARSRSAIVSPP